MRNNFQNKNTVRRVAVLDFCSSSLISGLIEDSQILIPASAFNLLQCIVFVKENLASQIRSWKGKIIYINFSDCCGYSSLTLQQNSANWFLRDLFVMWNPKAYNYSYSVLLSIYTALWMHDTKHHMLVIWKVLVH